LSSAYGGISPRGIEPIVPKENRSFDRFRRLWYPFSWRDLHRRYNADSVRRHLISNKDGLMSHAETTIGPFPKLPELDPEEVKAVRSFLPGKLLGRTAAFLSLVLLVVGFVSLADIGLRQLLGAELPIPLWLYWTLLIGLPFMAVVTQVIVEFRAERNRLLLQKLALRTGVELRARGWDVVETRAWQDPEEALRGALASLPGARHQSAGEAPELADLIEAAAGKAEKHLLLVLDQFEEFVILAKPQQREAFKALVAELQSRQIKGLRMLLVLRSDYQTVLEDVGLPPLRHGENFFQVGRFTLSAGSDFMKHSQLDLQPDAVDRLMTSAAELDETPWPHSADHLECDRICTCVRPRESPVAGRGATCAPLHRADCQSARHPGPCAADPGAVDYRTGNEAASLGAGPCQGYWLASRRGARGLDGSRRGRPCPPA
jgi:hypothetical protein